MCIRDSDGASCTELFLTVAREENISAAARVLHLAQPALSRQLRNLEEELGKALFTRGVRRIALTKEGRILKCRAEHMLSLAEKTKAEIMSHAETLEGDLYIDAGETMGVHYLTHVVSNLHKRFPGIRLRMSSGDSLDLANQLDSELLDFALLFSPIDPLKYNILLIPYENTWGLLMRQEMCIRDSSDAERCISDHWAAGAHGAAFGHFRYWAAAGLRLGGHGACAAQLL